MLRILSLKVKIEDKMPLRDRICHYLNIKDEELLEYKIIKRSLDARKKDQIYYSYMIDVHLVNEKKVLHKKKQKVTLTPNESYRYPKYGTNKMIHRPVIIGFGPAGMFAGLMLAKMGLKPIIYERGEVVELRKNSVQQFWQKQILNPESNIQFGEGGAGTFSDGKLTTRVKDLRSHYILKEFVEHGAPEEILHVNNPHIGTDILVDVVKNIREKIIELGGEIHFNSFFHDLSVENKKIQSIKVNDEQILVDDLILSIGHSARDTFTLLHNKGVEMKQKAFAVGVRIEHPQVLINQVQYGEKYAEFPQLGAAEYRLKHHASNDKSVYTFCMCPGGMVIPSSSEINTVVVNGMSEYARNQVNANSALVCTVNDQDFGLGALAGMEFQRELERKAFELGGSNYNAPVQRVSDFLKNIPSKDLGKVIPSYEIGYKLVNLNDLFPQSISLALKEAILGMDQKLHGFALDDAILTGIETRTSSPVRILRETETLESVNVLGLYPTGEGAGYAGGIMSSAIDGMRVAEKIVSKYKNM